MNLPILSIARHAPATLALALLAVGAMAQTPPSYQVEFLGKGAQVAAINASGTVAGTGSIGIYPRAIVAGPGQPVAILPLPLGFLSSGARDINDAGVIVGVMSPQKTTTVYPQPVKWEPDGLGGYTPTLLATLPGDNRGTADAINNLGDIVGTSSYLSSFHTVRFTPGGTVDLPGLGGLPPWALSDQRVYVSGGSRVDLNTLQVQPLGLPSGYIDVDSRAISITGQVAATLKPSSGCSQQPATFDDTFGWQLSGGCGSNDAVFDLNDHGDLLLTQGGDVYLDLAGGGLHRVADLLAPGAGSWTFGPVLDMALGDGLRIAVKATDGVQSGIVLLTPLVTCQGSLGFAGPGTAVLSLCGGDLSTGTTADLELTSAPPNAPVFFALGTGFQPVPLFGGTAVTYPVALVVGAKADALGSVTLPGFPGGGGPATLYVQAATFDATLPGLFGLSNALQVDVLP